MLRHILKRLLLAIPTMFVVVTIIFLLVRVIPGDPARAALGDYASEEAIQSLREELGLADPLWQQYITYMGNLLQADLGTSMVTRDSTWDQIQFVLPHTLELTFVSVVLALLLGIPIGVITAVRQNSALDYIGRVLSLMGLSIPAFFLGLLLIYFFSAQINLFPAIGAGNFSDPVDNIYKLVLPATSLALIEMSYVSRMTRSVMIGVLADDYVRTARAKGLIERTVLYKHAFRVSLVPVVSLAGIFVISLIGSSVLTETVFARPGLGKLMIGAIKQRDYTLLQAIMVLYAFIIVVINIITDLIYTYVDPRVRYD